jgi:hypothetical protein
MPDHKVYKAQIKLDDLNRMVNNSKKKHSKGVYFIFQFSNRHTRIN